APSQYASPGLRPGSGLKHHLLTHGAQPPAGFSRASAREWIETSCPSSYCIRESDGGVSEQAI
ncbi:MAG: hypothetical protein Q9M29_04995, partial [Mariprofundaceae bacterium]|nr:hypothetical protein [Mariprofundaceae bacterium]